MEKENEEKGEEVNDTTELRMEYANFQGRIETIEWILENC